MRVLVTGGTGFLGKHLQNAFKQTDFEVTFIGTSFYNKYSGLTTFHDFTHYNNALYTIEHFNPDVIIAAAAVCGGILANSNRPADFLRDNIQIGINIFEAAKKLGIEQIYTLGSICSYPVNCPTPFKEEDIWNGYPESTNAPYGHAKRTLLMLQQTYREQYGITGAHLIPTNLFGIYDNFDPITSHVIPALIRKFTTAVKNNLPSVQCWGTGEATREFLAAEDAAEAIVMAVVNNFDTHLPINLGVGKDISIKNLATLIAELTNFTGKIEFTGEVSDGQPKRLLDVSRAKDLLGWTAKSNFKDKLLETINWYQSCEK